MSSKLNTTVDNSSFSPSWEKKYESTYGPNVTSFTETRELPRELQFNEDTLLSVVAYGCLFVVALMGNLMVLTTLWGARRSRVNICIVHLALADLFITCIFLPIETIWHVTVSWRAGDLACRVCMLLRAFGFYLSSYITVAIAIDRYMSIVHPLMLSGSVRRCKIMLLAAYIVSFAFSVPQSVIFHVENHPVFKWFDQCVTFNFFDSESHELAYEIFSCMAVYVVPLCIIITLYTLILIKLSRQQRQYRKRNLASECQFTFWKRQIVSSPQKQLITSEFCSNTELRCSTARFMSRAKLRTLKMTTCIVAVFIICWTPYFFMLLFYWIAQDSAKQVDHKIQRVLFIFAVSNSCLDPLIYGMFTASFHRKFRKWRQYVSDKINGVTSSSPS